MKEEDILLKKVGKEPSFKTPEGYFENLTSEVMGKLPAKKEVALERVNSTMWRRMKPLAYMAAMFVGAALIIRVALSDSRSMVNEVATVLAESEVAADQMIDVAVDAAMMDDYSLYVYLSDASIE